MIVFPSMLIKAAKEVNMAVPEPVPEDIDSIKDDYPHFFVFCQVQLCRSLVYWGEHFDNAKVIMKFSEEEIMEITLDDLFNAGLIMPGV